MALTPILSLYITIVLRMLSFARDPMAAATACFKFEVRNLVWVYNLELWIVLWTLYFLFWFFQVALLLLIPVNKFLSVALFWPKLFWHLFGPDSEGRSLAEILTNPRNFGPRPSRRSRKKKRKWKERSDTYFNTLGGCGGYQARMVSLNPTHARLNVFTSYQVSGAFAGMASINNQVASSLTAATDRRGCIPYFDDPFFFATAYCNVGKAIGEPPDCALQFIWSLAWDILYSVSYLLVGLATLWYTRLMKRINGEPATVEDEIPIYYCLASTKSTGRQELETFDDGVPFLIDTGANCIISNVRHLFTDLKVQRCIVSTHSGEDERDRYIGDFKLELPDNDGVIHTYMIPKCIYDPDTDYNIIGLSPLAKFFGDTDPSGDREALDGTHVVSSSARTTLIWDHGKHKMSFMHTAHNGLPVVKLYKSNTYFDSFCTRLSRVYDSTVHYAFSSAYSIAPEKHLVLNSEADTESTANEGDEWYMPEVCVPCDSPSTNDNDFRLGQSLLYTRINKGSKKKKSSVQAISVVYEGVNADGKTHLVRLQDGTKMTVHDCDLREHLQPSFENIPSTPLEYRKEVGVGISQEEAQRLARPRTLSPVQQELLSWHQRLYHLEFPKLFLLARLGHLPKSLLKCEGSLPVCLECQFGKASRRKWRSKGKKSGTIKKKSETKPGDGVSVDQIVSAQPGWVPQMSGYLTRDRIWGATTFVDHVTDYVYVHLMKCFTIEETLAAKMAFENIFSAAGHSVGAYRADNGRFADKLWQDSCTRLKQALTFCGVGNHRQNGKIEAKNKYLTITARTLLLQGMRMWPEMISTYFWPFALKAAAERHNSLHVDELGRTPESKLYGIEQEAIPVKNYHPLFCPVFVLDHRLHSAGGSMPKWEPRSRCGVYLGHSLMHAGSVALVFNPRTGRVSPAYHVVFDDGFTTVPYMKAATLPPNWDDLAKNAAEIATTETYELADEWVKEMELTEGSEVDHLKTATRITDPFAICPDQIRNSEPLAQTNDDQEVSHVQPSEGENSSKRVAFDVDTNVANSQSNKRAKLNENNERTTAASFAPESAANAQNDEKDQPNPLSMPPIIDLKNAGFRRSARLAHKQNERADNRATENRKVRGVTLMAVSLYTAICKVGSVAMPDHNHYRRNRRSQDQPPSLTENLMTRFHEANELYDGTINQLHLMSFMTQDLTSNEVFTYWQAMKEPDREDFKDAMEKEISDHTEREHWEIVPRSSMPKGKKPIKSIWSMKRKRNPIGELLKHKARLCAHGGMQQWGENYWETYSPVVNMLTVRLLLLICKIHKLHSKSIDFVLAFPQADLEEEIWMEIPLGVDVESGDNEEYLLKLKKNLYGLKQGSHNWYKHLKEGLMKRGLNPSEIDPCLYLKEGLAVLTYVDDCILISDSQSEIDDLISSLQNGEEKFILTDEGDIDKFSASRR